MNLCFFIGLVIYSRHKVLKRIIRTFIVLAGLQNQCYRVTDCLLMHDALPSYRNGVLSLNRYIIILVKKQAIFKGELIPSARHLYVNLNQRLNSNTFYTGAAISWRYIGRALTVWSEQWAVYNCLSAEFISLETEVLFWTFIFKCPNISKNISEYSFNKRVC